MVESGTKDVTIGIRCLCFDGVGFYDDVLHKLPLQNSLSQLQEVKANMLIKRFRKRTETIIRLYKSVTSYNATAGLDISEHSLCNKCSKGKQHCVLIHKNYDAYKVTHWL